MSVIRCLPVFLLFAQVTFAQTLEAAVASRHQAKGSFFPRFDLEPGATRNDDMDGSEGANDDESAVVRMTYNIYRGGADRTRLNEAHVVSTEEVLLVYREQLTLGKRTLLDLLNVQNELLRAQISKVSGDYVALLARYRVLASTGQLLRRLEIDPESL